MVGTYSLLNRRCQGSPSSPRTLTRRLRARRRRQRRGPHAAALRGAGRLRLMRTAAACCGRRQGRRGCRRQVGLLGSLGAGFHQTAKSLLHIRQDYIAAVFAKLHRARQTSLCRKAAVVRPREHLTSALRMTCLPRLVRRCRDESESRRSAVTGCRGTALLRATASSGRCWQRLPRRGPRRRLQRPALRRLLTQRTPSRCSLSTERASAIVSARRLWSSAACANMHTVHLHVQHIPDTYGVPQQR